jgi:hypothetical protein
MQGVGVLTLGRRRWLGSGGGWPELRKKGRPGVGDVGKKRKETVLGVLDVEADEEVDGGASPRSGTGEVGHGVGGVHGSRGGAPLWARYGSCPTLIFCKKSHIYMHLYTYNQFCTSSVRF